MYTFINPDTGEEIIMVDDSVMPSADDAAKMPDETEKELEHKLEKIAREFGILTAN